MSVRQILLLIGILMGLLSFGLTLLWFGWKMALCFFLALWANNLCIRYESEQNHINKELGYDSLNSARKRHREIFNAIASRLKDRA